MLDPTRDDADLLKDGRKLFETAFDHYENNGWFGEHDRDWSFYNNDQWTDADRSALAEMGRPVLTFNVSRVKIEHLMGAMEDSAMEPSIQSNGIVNQPTADLLNTIKATILENLDADRVHAEVMEASGVGGIGNSAIDAIPDPINPAYIKIIYKFVKASEVLWDPSSVEKDRGDARYVFWSRWLTKAEFKAEYPKFKDKADELLKGQYVGPLESNDIVEPRDPVDPDKYRPARSNLYYDRRLERIRIIRCEYRVPKVSKVLIDSASGVAREMSAEMADNMMQLSPQLAFSSVWRDEVYWLEFCGGTVLFNALSPIPVDAFSLTAMVSNQDDDGLPFGKMRLLISPQQEVNKRFSQTLHLFNSQGAPGLFSEIDALVDEEQAKRSQREPAGITMLTKGGLQKIQVRQGAVMPDAMHIHEAAMRLIDLISGVWSDDITEPRGIPEAAATAQLKYRKSLMSMRPFQRSFDQFQKAAVTKIMALVLNAYSDMQIADILADEERYQVEGGVVLDKSDGSKIAFKDARKISYQVRLRPSETSNSRKSMELSALMGLKQVEIPVSPEVIYDAMPLPKEMREKLKKFGEMAGQQQAQTAKEQMEQANKLMENEHQNEVALRVIDMLELEEKKRSNQAKEDIQSAEVHIGTQERGADRAQEKGITEQAHILELVKTVSAMMAKAGQGKAQPTKSKA